MKAVAVAVRLSIAALVLGAGVNLGMRAAVPQAPSQPPPAPSYPVYPVTTAPPVPSAGSSSDTSQATVPPLAAQTVPSAGTPCMMPRPASTAVCLYGVWMEPERVVIDPVTGLPMGTTEELPLPGAMSEPGAIPALQESTPGLPLAEYTTAGYAGSYTGGPGLSSATLNYDPRCPQPRPAGDWSCQNGTWGTTLPGAPVTYMPGTWTQSLPGAEPAPALPGAWPAAVPAAMTPPPATCAGPQPALNYTCVNGVWTPSR